MVKLVRQASDVPNITNRDDTRMIRYAYGGHNGFVKDFGSELDSSYTGGVFKILSGRVVLDGWEVDIDESGWQLPVEGMSGTQYYSIYLEINLVTETAEIKSTYGTGDYPSIEKGDDLTTYPSGVARLLLHTVRSISGVIIETDKKVKAIPYTKNTVEDIERRLDLLGFRVLPTEQSSQILVSGAPIGELAILAGNSDTREGSFREGNFVCLRMSVDFSYDGASSYSRAQDDFYWYGNTATVSFNLPDEFKPKHMQTLYTSVNILTVVGEMEAYFDVPVKIVINTDGSITMTMSKKLSPGLPYYKEYAVYTVGYSLQISYEANPL